MTGSTVIGLPVSNLYRPSREANLYTKQTALDVEADAGVVLGVGVTVDPSFSTRTTRRKHPRPPYRVQPSCNT